MALETTETLRHGIKLGLISPTLILKIDGYDELFSNIAIKKYIRIGDPGLLIGTSWYIGGYSLIENNSPYISYNSGDTTTKISQKLDPSRGLGSSVSQMAVTLIDKNGEITNLISSQSTLDEMLGRFCTVYMGLDNTAWPEDYNIVFQGVIHSITSNPNEISFYLNNTEEKKRSTILYKLDTKNTVQIEVADTSVTVLSTTDFLLPQDTLQTYLIVDDELIKYTGKTSNTFTGLSRAQENSTLAVHSVNKKIAQMIRLTDNGLTMALKLMLSTGPEYFIEDLAVKSFEYYDTVLTIDNAIFFSEVDLEKDYGVALGDYVTISGAINGGNNIVNATVADIGIVSGGSYVILNTGLILEANSTASAFFKSPYNTLPIGLGMMPREVDVKQHQFIRDTFLQIFDLDIYIDEIKIGKDFLEQQIYLPMTCYSVPRKGRSSVVLHIAPLPTYDIKQLTSLTVIHPDKIKLQRSLSENFFNGVQFQYDYNPITEEPNTVKTFNSTKSSLIPIGKRSFTIDSLGLRTSLGGDDLAQLAARRFLKRYERGAEYIKGIQIDFKTGYEVEIGDVVAMDYASLKMSDYQTGDRNGKIRLMEVLNKTIDNKAAQVSIDVVNTIFGVNDRYGLISPATIIGSGSTTTKIVVQKSYGTKAFEFESNKWTDYIGQDVIVHSEDWSLVYTTQILGVDKLEPESFLINAAPTAPQNNWILQCPVYPTSTDESLQSYWKFRHAFLSPQVLVTNAVAISQVQFEVSPSDITKFFVNADVMIHNYDYSQESPEAIVTNVDLTFNTVTIDTATGFPINNNHFVDLIGFADLKPAYRII